jgi:hypothetical protein
MLFNFQTFIQELRENPEKKEVIEKYEKFFGPIEGELKDQLRYTEYVTNFAALAYRVPDELTDDFDWELLMQLVGASFSSDGLIENGDEENPLPEFIISVQSGDQVVVKKISELRGFQILRLYEIYAEEQMNLQILIAEDEKEKEAIIAQRDSRANRWKLVLENLEKEKLQKVDKAERADKLDDLMGQL